MEEQTERQELADLLREVLAEQGVADAVMLRRVMRMREAVHALDLELAVFQRYFTLGAASPDQTPPS